VGPAVGKDRVIGALSIVRPGRRTDGAWAPTGDIPPAVNDGASHGPALLNWERTFLTRRASGSATPPLRLSGGGFEWFYPADSEVS
jgi:hypothetical protein